MPSDSQEDGSHPPRNLRRHSTVDENDATLPPSKEEPSIDVDATLPPNSSASLSHVDDATIAREAGDEPEVVASSSPSESQWRAGGKLQYFGDYELLAEIARGGMGVVYQAKQTSLNRIVALKMILSGQFAGEEEVQRFRTEAEAAANLDHPGIVPVYEVGQLEGQHYFSMGYVDGQSLTDLIVEHPLPPKQAAKLVGQVCEAIEYAHQRGVVHRDLKPANILLTKDGQPKVTDFGLAKSTQADSNLTGTGQILGTPSYMPPEQAAGNTNEIGPVADVYALGAVLYCLLTGRPPFQSANAMDTLMQVLEKEPAALRSVNSNIPRDLETISLKCLQKDSRKRYSSAAELGAELQRYLGGEPIKARPISWLAKVWRWCRRHPRESILVGSLAGVVLTAAFMIFGAVGLAVRERVLTTYRARIDDQLAYDKVENAEVLLQEMAAEFPSASQTKDAFINFALRTPDDSKADQYVAQAIEISPQDDFSLVKVGDRYFFEGRPERALEFYEAAYAINPSYSGTVFAIGRDYVEMQRYEDALPFLDQLIAKGSEEFFFRPSRCLVVEVFMGLSRYDEAETELTSLIAEYPQDSRVLDVVCEFIAESPTEYRPKFVEHLESLKSRKAIYLATVGDNFRRRQRLAEAENFYLRSLEADPTYVGAAFALARDALKAESFAESLQYFERAQELASSENPLSAAILRGLIASHIKLGNIETADAFAREFAEKYPADDYLAEVLLEVADARVAAIKMSEVESNESDASVKETP